MPIDLATRTKTYPVIIGANGQKYGAAAIRLYKTIYPDIADLSAQPIMLFIHGGGWSGGSYFNDNTVIKQLPALARIGWVCYTIDYTRTVHGDASTQWPQQAVDVQGFLGALADGTIVGGNTANIWLLGYSAGSHLAMMQGLAGKGHWPDSEHPSTAYTVQGIISRSGPTNLERLYASTGNPVNQTAISDLLGYVPSTNSAGALLASPEGYISASPPHLMLMGGSLDTDIPPTDQSAITAGLFATAGATVFYNLYAGLDHSSVEWTLTTSQVYYDLQAFAEGYGR